MTAIDAQKLTFVTVAGGVQLDLKVVPGASRTKVTGLWGAALKVAVAAPPEGGKANAAVIEVIADVFGLKRGDVQIISGQTKPLKRVLLAGLTVTEARQRLATE